MRLLNTNTFELETFLERYVPPYAILSHTWGRDEFVFEDLKTPIKDQLSNPKRGLKKVMSACSIARKNSWNHIWIDTCCIDKSSSTELSGAINSMFKWYRGSAACYVWLEDVGDKHAGFVSFSGSKWFSRGWTLQELIASHGVVFYDHDWRRLGTRYDMAERIAFITGIQRSILHREHAAAADDSMLTGYTAPLCPACRKPDDIERSLQSLPIAQRMRWVVGRDTTRAEDMAYSLLGLFGVNMPLLYGEGDKSFSRLLAEIINNGADQSILLWSRLKDWPGYSNGQWNTPFPPDPSYYNLDLDIMRNPDWEVPEIMATPHGLELDVFIAPCSALPHMPSVNRSIVSWGMNYYVAVLSCLVDHRLTAAGIVVKSEARTSLQTNPIIYRRVPELDVVKIITVDDDHNVTDSLGRQISGVFLQFTTKPAATSVPPPGMSSLPNDPAARHVFPVDVFKPTKIILANPSNDHFSSRPHLPVRLDMSSCRGYRVLASIPGLHPHSGGIYSFNVDSTSAEDGCLALLVDKHSLANPVIVYHFKRVHGYLDVKVLSWDSVMHDENGETLPRLEESLETTWLEQVRRMLNSRYALEPEARSSHVLCEARLRASVSENFFLGQRYIAIKVKR